MRHLPRIGAIGLLGVMIGRGVVAYDFITEEFEPLEQMVSEDIPLWGWSHIHTRCAGVYLFAQWTAANNHTIDNDFIDTGEGHLAIATRLYGEGFHESTEGAADFTHRLAHGLAAKYAELAEARLTANEDPLSEPLIASDLAFCRELGNRVRI